MNLLHRLQNIFRREAAPAPSSLSNLRSALPATPAPAPVNTGMHIATVYRCVRLLSESVASLPLQIRRQNGPALTVDTTTPLHRLLNVETDPATSAFDFWRAAVVEILLEGNAYILPQHTGTQLTALHLCNRGTVTHNTTANTYTITDPAAKIKGRFDHTQIIHLKGLPNPRDRRRGLSVLTHARTALTIAATGDRETQARFENGGDVRGIVSNGTQVQGFGEYQDEQLTRTAISIDGRFRSGERIVSLPGQVDFKQLSMSSADMQFLESRKFAVKEICRFFGVHPSFVFDDTAANYKSSEQATAAFLTYTLGPLLKAIETELTRKLTTTPGTSIQFDRSGLMATDLDSRLKYQAALISTGLMTVNELRRLENRPPLPGGDTLMVSANLRPLQETENTPAK